MTDLPKIRRLPNAQYELTELHPSLEKAHTALAEGTFATADWTNLLRREWVRRQLASEGVVGDELAITLRAGQQQRTDRMDELLWDAFPEDEKKRLWLQTALMESARLGDQKADLPATHPARIRLARQQSERQLQIMKDFGLDEQQFTELYVAVYEWPTRAAGHRMAMEAVVARAAEDFAKVFPWAAEAKDLRVEHIGQEEAGDSWLVTLSGYLAPPFGNQNVRPDSRSSWMVTVDSVNGRVSQIASRQ